jgi:prepilin-type N-terminal cleavage/methylation domain-containing protein
MNMRNAFTLIELLVVITIITLLLALLSPALDRAIDEALMAKCGAQLKGVGTGALAYAVQNTRAYLNRPHVQNSQAPKTIPGEGKMVGVVFGPFTFSRWWNNTGRARPPISSQHVFDDNSIVRFDEVRWDEHLVGGGQERMDRVPVYTNNQDPNLFFHVPRSGR